MTIYILLYIYILLLGFVFYKRRPYSVWANTIFAILVFGAMYFIASFRGISVGTDTYDYVFAYKYGIRGWYRQNWELLFVLLMNSVREISSSYTIFFCVCYLIVFFGLGYFFINNTEKKYSLFWSLALFLILGQFFSTMNLLRQTLAMSIGCNVYTVLQKGINRRNIIISLFLVITSALFHKSGFICALLFLPFLMQIDRKTLFIVIIFGLLSYLVFPLLFRLLIRLVPVYGRYARIGVGDVRRYSLLAIIEVTIIVIYMIFLDPHDEANIEKYRLLFVIGISFAFIVLQRRIGLAQRFGYYFELFLYILIPQFCEMLTKQRDRIIVKSIVLILGSLYFGYALTLHGKGCIPYSFFWQ